jgi:phage-related minor tail protein
MTIPIDFTTFVTTVASSAVLGLAVACGKLWVDMHAVKSDLAAVKRQSDNQNTELRQVAETLAQIQINLEWIKQKLSEVKL